jgi:hypothetical protein
VSSRNIGVFYSLFMRAHAGKILQELGFLQAGIALSACVTEKVTQIGTAID